ncbi:MAG: methyltransferase domain-containing protein [Deltaproteobacteria bacterium]|nr:methyltransferase domain-containing protein [Deltaproteobacteria bacterium]
MSLSEMAKALGDETRVRLLGLLARHELNVGEIVQVMECSQPRVSRHLKILAGAGLVDWRKDGQWVFYRVAREGSAGLFVEALRPFFDREEQVREDLSRAEAVVASRREQARSFFDQAAARWEQLNREVLGDFDLAGRVAELASGCRSLVDLGCGPGTILKRLTGHCPLLIGVDSSPRMLERAGQVLGSHPGVSLRIGDLEHLPLRDGEVGCAVMSLVLHHLDDPLTVIREVARVMAEGGRFVLIDFERHRDEALRTRFHDRWLGFSGDEIRTWLEQAGFKAEDPERMEVNNGLVIMIFTARRKSN